MTAYKTITGKLGQHRLGSVHFFVQFAFFKGATGKSLLDGGTNGGGEDTFLQTALKQHLGTIQTSLRQKLLDLSSLGIDNTLLFLQVSKVQREIGLWRNLDGDVRGCGYVCCGCW